jgi:hypothetical protein
VNENDVAPKTFVVYHGTSEKFKRFSMMKSTMGHIWFSSSKERILKGEAGASGKGYIVTAEVTFQKPAGWAEYERMGTAELKRDGFDGAILPDDDYFDCVVFSPNQIKVLKIEQV